MVEGCISNLMKMSKNEIVYSFDWLNPATMLGRYGYVSQ